MSSGTSSQGRLIWYQVSVEGSFAEKLARFCGSDLADLRAEITRTSVFLDLKAPKPLKLFVKKLDEDNEELVDLDMLGHLEDDDGAFNFEKLGINKKNLIIVKPQAPPPAPHGTKRPWQDKSWTVCDNLVKLFDKPPQSIVELKTFMTEDFCVKVPACANEVLKTMHPELGDVFDDDDLNCDSFLGIQIGAGLAYRNQRANVQEDMMHFLIDSLIRAPLEEISRVLGLPVTIERNSTDSGTTTVKQSRPDFLARIDDTLFFWGEEKADSGAYDDLLVKFTQFDKTRSKFQNFMICYAADGFYISFFLIDGWKSKASFVPLMDKLPLNNIHGRLDILKITINIARLFRTLVFRNEIPPGYPIAKKVKYSRSEITYGLSYVKKQVLRDQLPFIDGSMDDRMAFLRDMYNYAKGKHGLVQIYNGPIVNPESGLYSVKLLTKGLAIRSFDSEEIMRNMASDILLGLSSLHEEGYLHGDVRLPNIVYVSESDEYVLIDFEHGGRDWTFVQKRKTRSHGNNNVENRVYHKDHERLNGWDEGTLDDGIYTVKSELYQFGKLLDRFSHMINTEAGKRFVQKLLNKELTAKAALEEQWFKISL